MASAQWPVPQPLNPTARDPCRAANRITAPPPMLPPDSPLPPVRLRRMRSGPYRPCLLGRPYHCLCIEGFLVQRSRRLPFGWSSDRGRRAQVGNSTRRGRRKKQPRVEMPDLWAWSRGEYRRKQGEVCLLSLKESRRICLIRPLRATGGPTGTQAVASPSQYMAGPQIFGTASPNSPPSTPPTPNTARTISYLLGITSTPPPGPTWTRRRAMVMLILGTPNCPLLGVRRITNADPVGGLRGIWSGRSGGTSSLRILCRRSCSKVMR